MKTSKDVIDALKKEGPGKAFDTFFSIVGYHSFLEKCGLSDLQPHVPHKMYLCIQRIACKTHEGGYAALNIALDWLTQELIIEVTPVIKDVIPLPLEKEEVTPFNFIRTGACNQCGDCCRMETLSAVIAAYKAAKPK